jgi:hypothetical protein
MTRNEQERATDGRSRERLVMLIQQQLRGRTQYVAPFLGPASSNCTFLEYLWHRFWH